MTTEYDAEVYADRTVDPRSAGDRARGFGSVVRRPDGGWEVVGHAEVVQAAVDSTHFSSRVSAHLQLPNGLDGDQHRRYRTLIDRYFAPERITALEPMIRAVAGEVVGQLLATDDPGHEAATGPGQPTRTNAGASPRPVSLDAVRDLGAPFAVRVQRRWLGWPESVDASLLQWVADNQAASRSQDHAQKAQVAQRFDEIIRSVLAPRRAIGAEAPADVTTELIEDDSLGRKLSDEELVSILRNWTGGDLGSIALCVGVILQFLAEHPTVQSQVRAGTSRAELAAIIDEILRIDDPFVSNRRVTACPVDLAGIRMETGEQLRLNWTSANRDEEVFPDPDIFDPCENARRNLVYGTGDHVCPGRGLATVELCILVEELVAATSRIAADPRRYPVRAQAPGGGYDQVPLLAWCQGSTG